MALPQLTDEQRKAALEKAAAARHARAELREKIKKGEVTLQEVLDSDDPIANRLKVSALIESLPGYGKAKAQKIMDELGISSRRYQSSDETITTVCNLGTVRCRQRNARSAAAQRASRARPGGFGDYKKSTARRG